MGLDAFSLECEKVAAQLVLQSDGLDLEVICTLPFYKYRVRDLRAGDQAAPMVARCLPDTWSLYEQRFHQAAKSIDLLIVRDHNAASPVPVLSLEDGRYYRAGAIPDVIRPDMQRRNQREQRLIVSLLALGLEAGDQALAAMSEKSQRRYKAMLSDYLKRPRGRSRSL
jgi:hypothetical protein